MEKLLIYTHKTTNRNRYIFNFILKEILHIPFVITNNKEEFIQHNGPAIAYCNQPIGKGLFIQSKNILFENGLSEQNIHISEVNGCPAFFTTSEKCTFGFDIFAASFFLVSRYEEYLPHIRDIYNRFDATSSIAFQGNFLQMPVIDKWAIQLKKIIQEHYPSYVIPERKYNYVSTIDIDNAFAYREKGFVRTIGGYARALKNMDVKELKERTNVLLGKEKDPYDTYDHLLDIQKKYNINTIYFFLLGDYGVNDKNVPSQSHKFQSLIKSIADYSDTGIHPSFASNKHPERLKKEIGRLSKIVNNEIHKSRQHFLKLVFPETYRNLIMYDILEDYSMGYASHPGFRAGTCTPFSFYDLDSEIETKLKIYPFTFMEATLKYYQKIKPENALAYIAPYIDEVKKVNGTLITLWHNESLSENDIWKGWKQLYEDVVAIACKK